MRLILRSASVGLMLAVSSCSGGSPACENQVLDTVSSPSGRLSAIVFTRNCGATTGYNMQVSVVPRGAPTAEKGNALVLDHVPTYSTVYRPSWGHEQNLLLTIPRGSRVFKKSPAVGETQVTFRQL